MKIWIDNAVEQHDGDDERRGARRGSGSLRPCRLMCGGGSAPPAMELSLLHRGCAPEMGHSPSGCWSSQKVGDLPHIRAAKPRG